MRLRDVLHPYLDGITLVTESHEGSLSMRAYLDLPPGVAYERRGGKGDVRAADRESGHPAGQILELAMFGPDPVLHGPESDALDAIRRLEPGDRSMILFGYETHALPFHRLLDDLTAAHAQVVQVSALEYDHIHAAAIVTAGDRLEIPRDLLGEPLAPDEDRELGDPVFVRIANEFVFTEFVSRNLRAQLYRIEFGASGSADPAMEQADRDLEQARAEVDQAKAEAARAWAEAEQARADASRIAGSTSYQLGKTLVETARGRRRVTSVPRALVRVWRKSGDHGPDSAASVAQTSDGRVGGPASYRQAWASGIATDTSPGRAGDRIFLEHRAVAISARTRPVVLGILSGPTAGALAADAIVDRVTPNDALLTLERSEPDVVLVEAAALGPSHPWAFAANAAAVERAALLIELVERAHKMGRPAVLVRDSRSADHVGLVPIEPKFDLVIDTTHGPDGGSGWSRGVQLGRFNPIGAPATRESRPLFVGGLDPRARFRERRLLESVLRTARDHGLEIGLDADAPIGWDAIPEDLRENVTGRIGWSGLAPLYRRRALTIANPFTDDAGRRAVDVRTLEQLASGVRVLSGPHQALDGVAGPHVTVAHDADDAARAIGDALDAGLPTPAQMRVLLRSLFLNDATPVMLNQVTRRLGLPTDPLASRSVTAVVALDDGADIDAIVGSITGQAHLPRRTVIWRADGVTWPEAADTAIANAGIEIDVQTASAGRPDWSRLESDETTEWLSLWPSRRAVAPTFLLDLLIGGEMACADAVGYQPREGFEFVPSIGLESAIVRRGALPDAGGWRRPSTPSRPASRTGNASAAVSCRSGREVVA